MKNKEAPSLERAKNYAFLLLKFRPRSEYEIYQRLKKKKLDEEVIKGVLSFLKEKAFLDDKLFTCAWIESRLKKPFGLHRIRQELKLKGIDQQIINSQVAALKEGYSEEEIVRKIARARLAKTKNIALQTAKRRIFSYLIRRGFSADIVSDTVKELWKQIY